MVLRAQIRRRGRPFFVFCRFSSSGPPYWMGADAAGTPTCVTASGAGGFAVD